MRTMYLASLALALAAGTAGIAAAQATSTPATGADAAQATVAPTPPPTAASHRSHHRWGRRHLFRGVKLTSEQRARLKNIRGQYRPQLKTLRHEARLNHAVLRRAEAAHDSTAMTAARTKMQDTQAQFATLRDHWRADARGVLTPDQQAQFDRNLQARH
jgi:Spy/CpxP family protein refolding chaperone